MNLQVSITLYAGGPGSGCHGNDCGRPRTRAEETADQLARLHDEIKDNPSRQGWRSDDFFKQRQEVAFMLDRLPGLKKAIENGTRPLEGYRKTLIKDYLRKADSEYQKAKDNYYEQNYSTAIVHTETSLMLMHDAIRNVDKLA